MFDRIELLIGKDNLEKIKSKTVLVVGAGGVGGSSIMSLVRSGIENIIIIDFDVIEESNLNRQEISFIDTVGKKKTDACKKLIQNINPNCNVKLYDLFLDSQNIKEIFDSNKIDFVIDAIDSIDSKKSIIMECINRKIKFISSMGTGKKTDPSKLKVTKLVNTFNDPIAKILRKWAKDNKIKEKIMVVSSEEIVQKSDSKIIPSMCFVPNSAGILMASYVINEIIKEKK